MPPHGADGIAFALQNQGDSAIGGGGGNGVAINGISDAFGIKFDTHTSTYSQFFRQGQVTAADGVFDNYDYHENMEDGQWRDVVITWDASTTTLSYSISGQVIDSIVYDVVANDFGGDSSVYFGFGAGTGMSTNQQQVEIVSVQTGSLQVNENAANGTVVGVAAGIDPDLGTTLTYSLTDNAGGRFAIDSNTGVVTVADGSLLDFESATSHDVTIQVSDGSLTYSETMSISVDNGSGDAALAIPIGQSVDEDTPLTFSTGSGNAITIESGSPNNPVLTTTLSVTNGTLTLAATTGITFLDGTSDGSGTLTISGTEAAINTALNGLQYQGNQDYNGSDTLTVTTGSAAAAEANLYARYEFLIGSLEDETANNYDGDVTVGDPTLTNDAERGDVMTFDGDDRVHVTNGTSGLGEVMTISAWVNLDAGQTNSTFLSLGDEVYVVLDPTNTSQGIGGRVGGFTSYSLDSNDRVAGTGWRHIALTLDDANNELRVYLDGELTRSSNYSGMDADWVTAASQDIILGGLSDGSRAFVGSIDDARVYDRVLSEAEIIAVMGDNGYDSETVNITVNAVNDPAVVATNTGISVTEGGSVTITTANLNEGDPDDSGAGVTYRVRRDVEGGSLFLNGTVLGRNDLFSQADVDAGLVSYTHAGGEDTTEVIRLAIVDGGEDGAGETDFQIAVSVNSANDAPVAADDPTGSFDPVTDSDTVGFWRLGEGSGTTAVDSAIGNNGTYSSTSLGATGAVTGDTAADFDGTSSHVNLGNLDVAGTGITMAAWINADNFGNSDGRIFAKSDGTANADTTWMLSVVDVGPDVYLRLRLSAGNHTELLVASDFSLSTSQWYHVAATYDQSTGDMAIYVNGNLVEFGAHSVGGAVDQDPAQDVWIGGNPAGGNYFDGRIDEALLMQRALTAGEIAVLADQAPSDYSVGEGATLSVNTANGILRNDSDVEGDSLSVIEVNGSNASVGNQITLGSGALLTVNADGSFDYDPNGQFESLAVGQTANDSFSYTISDGNGGTDTATVTLTINAVNDAPVLDDGAGLYTLNTITEDDISNGGQTVASIIASNAGFGITDADSGAVEGIAMTSSSATNGHWEFSTDGGTNWSDVGTVSASNALVLRDSDLIRFVPNGERGDFGIFNFRAWDQTDGSTPGTKIDAQTTGGDAAFSDEFGVARITVSDINDEEVLETNTGTTVTEGSTGTVITTAMLETTDVDHTAAQLVYTVDAVTSNGTLRLNGTALGLNDTFTQADIDLGRLTYDHDGSQTSADSFDFTVDDGEGTTTSSTFNFTVTNVNDAPVVTVSSVDLNFTEQSPVGIDVSATISDVDDVDLEGAVIQITSNYESGFDELSFTNQNGISGVWDSGSGTLTLSGTATVAEYESAIQSIVFYNSSDQPSLLTRTVRWTVNDGDTDSVSVTRDIVMNAVNDEEVLSTNTGTTVSEGSTGTVITTAMLHTTDVDNTDAQLVYTVDAVPTNGTLRLSGTALGLNDTFTQADIDAGNVTYDHDGSQTSADSFDFTVDDGAGTTTSDTFNFTVTNVNDAPVITSGPGGGTHFEGGGTGTYFNNGLTITDADSVDFDGGVLTTTITGNGETGDRLLVRDGNGVSVSGSDVRYDFGGGPVVVGTFTGGDGTNPLVVTFNASADQTAVEAVAQQVAYRTEIDDPSELLRTIEMSVTDGDGGTSATATRGMNVINVNDAPVTSVTAFSPTFTENGGPVGLFNSASVDLIEAGDLVSQIVLTVDNIVDGANERIQVDGTQIELTDLNSETSLNNGFDIDVSVSGSTATLTITQTGGFSNTDAQALLNGLTFSITGDEVVSGTRDVTFVSLTDDGGGDDTNNNGTVSTVTIVGANDDPTNAGSLPTDITVTEDVLGNVDLSLIDISDADHMGSNLTVRLSTSTGGNLTATAVAGITIGSNASNQITLTGSQADLNTYLNTASNIQYLHGTPNTFGNDADTVQVEVSDNGNTGPGGGSYIDFGTVNVDITAVNDEEVLATNTGTTVAEGSTGTVITTAMLETTDVDNTAAQLVYTVDSATSNGTLRLSGTALGMNDTFTQADIDAGNVTYDHNGSQTSADSFDFTVDDGAGTTTSSTFNFTVTNVNDAPVNTVPGAQSVDEDTAINLTGISVADTDDNLSTVQLTVGNGTLNVTLSGAATGQCRGQRLE